jgi:hypothetical protein
MMNWKGLVCDNVDNSEVSLRCLCGHEIVETDIHRLQIITPPNLKSNRSIWKDSGIVIGISLAVAVSCIPFENILPTFLKGFANHYTSIVGYFFLCYFSRKFDIRHLLKVSLVVWAIFSLIYIIMFWDLIGTKYSLKSIVFGGICSEIISALIAGSTYFIVTNIKKAIFNIKKSIFIRNDTEKPKWLRETTILMGIFNIDGLLFLNQNTKYFGVHIFLLTLLISVSYFVLWYYWNGRNWARILVMFGSILSLVNPLYIKKYPFTHDCFLLAEALLGLFLLWWLNTQPAKTYFSNRK